MTDKRTSEHFKAGILGSAVGDALGALVQSMTMNQIRSDFGNQGLTGFTDNYNKPSAITDNTQTLLFTTEGLILSRVRQEYQGDKGVITSIYHALLRWVYTQKTSQQDNLVTNHGTCSIVDGVLTGFKELFVQRSPDKISLSALSSGKMGRPDDPINQSKGSNSLVRAVPAGLAFSDPEKAFYFGCQIAALTHGHPLVYLSAGTLSALISLIISESSLSTAIENTCHILKSHQRHDQVLKPIGDALDITGKFSPSPEVIDKIALNWTAANVLGVCLYSSLEAQTDFKNGCLLSINHSGPSHVTGAISGSILGALLGLDATWENWRAEVELKDLIEETAIDLFEQFRKS